MKPSGPDWRLVEASEARALREGAADCHYMPWGVGSTHSLHGDHTAYLVRDPNGGYVAEDLAEEVAELIAASPDLAHSVAYQANQIAAVLALHTGCTAVASANIDDPEVEFDVWVCGHCWGLMNLQADDLATGPVPASVIWPCPTAKALGVAL